MTKEHINTARENLSAFVRSQVASDAPNREDVQTLLDAHDAESSTVKNLKSELDKKSPPKTKPAAEKKSPKKKK